MLLPSDDGMTDVSLGAAKGLLTLRAVLGPNQSGWLGFVGATILVWLGARSLNARRKLDANVSNEKTVEAG